MGKDKQTESEHKMTINEPTVEQMMMLAIEKYGPEGAESGVAVLERLMNMKWEQEKRDAQKEFTRLLAEFQAECPLIPKTAKVSYASSKGGDVDYAYAPLDTITEITRPLLAPRGFSVSWDTETIFENGKPFIRAKARLLHQNGHSIESTFTLPVPDKIGNMSEDKRHSAIKTKATREAVGIVLGLVTTDDDTDGNAEDPTTISAELAVDLQKKVKAAEMPEDKFLKFMGVKQYPDIKVSDYRQALMAIRQGQQTKEMQEIKSKIDSKDEPGELPL